MLAGAMLLIILHQSNNNIDSVILACFRSWLSSKLLGIFINYLMKCLTVLLQADMGHNVDANEGPNQLLSDQGPWFLPIDSTVCE